MCRCVNFWALVSQLAAFPLRHLLSQQNNKNCPNNNRQHAHLHIKHHIFISDLFELIVVFSRRFFGAFLVSSWLLPDRHCLSLSRCCPTSKSGWLLFRFRVYRFVCLSVACFCFFLFVCLCFVCWLVLLQQSQVIFPFFIYVVLCCICNIYCHCHHHFLCCIIVVVCPCRHCCCLIGTFCCRCRCCCRRCRRCPTLNPVGCCVHIGFVFLFLSLHLLPVFACFFVCSSLFCFYCHCHHHFLHCGYCHRRPMSSLLLHVSPVVDEDVRNFFFSLCQLNLPPHSSPPKLCSQTFHFCSI